MTQVLIAGSFDDLKFQHVRFLQEAARLGDVHVLLWTDDVVRAIEGCLPKFRQAERHYFLQAIRYVDCVTLIDQFAQRDALPPAFGQPARSLTCPATNVTVTAPSERVSPSPS